MSHRNEDPLESSLLDIRNLPADDEPLMLLGDIPIMTKGNISAIVGPPKTRKTFLASLIASAYFNGENDALYAPLQTKNLLWIDTEQAPRHCSVVYRRINRMRGLNPESRPEDFHFHCLREYDTASRVEIVSNLFDLYHPELVIIDGIADLVHSQNDEEEAAAMQDFLLNKSKVYDCHIISVIHSNYGSDKARGHTGANLTRKCETIMTLSANSTTTKVSFTSRDISPNPIAFGINADGIPEFQSPEAEAYRTFETLFASVCPVPTAYSQLAQHIIQYSTDHGNPVSEVTAKRHIRKATELGILHKPAVGVYALNPDRSPL